MRRKEEMARLRRQGKTLREIGEVFGITREGVRQAIPHVVPGSEVSRCFDAVEIVVEDPWQLGKVFCNQCGGFVGVHGCGSLCGACYSRQLYAASPERRRMTREWNYAWRRENPEAWRTIDRRAKRGRCPLCDRDYANIRQHLKSQHPEDYRALLGEVNREKALAREKRP